MEQQPKPKNNTEEDIDILEYKLDEIEQELVWQFNAPRIDELKRQKKELQEKIEKSKDIEQSPLLDPQHTAEELFWTLFDQQQFSSIEEVRETIESNKGTIEWMRETAGEPQWNVEQKNHILNQMQELESETTQLEEKLDAFHQAVEKK